MDELGVRSAHIAGASMGGMIAQELALRHPDRVLSLQLHCTTAHVDEWGRAVIDNFLRAKAHGNVEEFTLFVLPWLLCRKTFAERRDFVEMWIQRALEYPFQTTLVGLNRQAQAIRGHDTRDRLATLRMPTLVTTGTEDILVPPSASDDLHARIAGSDRPHSRGGPHALPRAGSRLQRRLPELPAQAPELRFLSVARALGSRRIWSVLSRASCQLESRLWAPVGPTLARSASATIGTRRRRITPRGSWWG
jgi:pimeloyl-ACP methyl ester carboxylesterase